MLTSAGFNDESSQESGQNAQTIINCDCSLNKEDCDPSSIVPNQSRQ
jgi:hypothetical protein